MSRPRYDELGWSFHGNCRVLFGKIKCGYGIPHASEEEPELVEVVDDRIPLRAIKDSRHELIKLLLVTRDLLARATQKYAKSIGRFHVTGALFAANRATFARSIRVFWRQRFVLGMIVSTDP